MKPPRQKTPSHEACGTSNTVTGDRHRKGVLSPFYKGVLPEEWHVEGAHRDTVLSKKSSLKKTVALKVCGTSSTVTGDRQRKGVLNPFYNSVLPGEWHVEGAHRDTVLSKKSSLKKTVDLKVYGTSSTVTGERHTKGVFNPFYNIESSEEWHAERAHRDSEKSSLKTTVAHKASGTSETVTGKRHTEGAGNRYYNFGPSGEWHVEGVHSDTVISKKSSLKKTLDHGACGTSEKVTGERHTKGALTPFYNIACGSGELQVEGTHSDTVLFKKSSLKKMVAHKACGTSKTVTVSPDERESDQTREDSFIKEPPTKYGDDHIWETKINTPCHDHNFGKDFIQKGIDVQIAVQEKRILDIQICIQAAEPMTDFAKELFSSDLHLNEEMQKILLATISKKLSDEYGQSIISTWAGTETSSGETVLVCLHSGLLNIKFSKFLGFDVIYREFDRIERESAIARTSLDNRKAKLSEEDITLINNAIKKHGDELFSKHSNLEAISSSAIVSSNHGRKLSPKICLVLYCRVKGIIPFGESPFPRCLCVGDQQIDVDVREGYFCLYAFKPDPNRGLPQRGDDISQVLRMGCSIGRADCKLKGTLGPFVRIADDSIGFLTCAHVLGDLSNLNDFSQLKNLEVVQPSNIDYMSNQSNQTDRVCGVIQEIEFSHDWVDPVSNEKCGAVDAALIRITNRAPSREEFAWIDQTQLSDAGFGTDLPVYEDGSFKAPLGFADCGTRIVKCGASTGLRKGTLSTTTCWVRMHESGRAPPSLKVEDAQLTLPSLTSDTSRSVIMKNLIHVDPIREVFFELGDSGAGVFMVDKENHLTCIGLAIGCLSDYRCVMTPIDRVLKALGLVNESLKAFPQELMETNEI